MGAKPRQGASRTSDGPRQCWLMKSEPDVFGIDDLAKSGETSWDGVRNFQARNFMRDRMRVGDPVLFYHSNAKPPGVAGLARVSAPAHPDHTALDPASDYYDPKSTPENPRWMMVDVAFVEKFPDIVSLAELRETPGLEDMLVIKRGMRLSIQPVTTADFDRVVAIGRAKKPA